MVSPKKSVQFNPKVVMYLVEEASTPDDLKQVQRNVDTDTKYLQTRGYDLLLENGFDEHDENAQKQVNAFSRLPGVECARGLEMSLSQHLRSELQRNHTRVSEGVLGCQKALLDMNASSEIMAEKLRSISRKYSRRSRVFARRLGIADERAVKKGDDLWKAQEMVKEQRLSLSEHSHSIEAAAEEVTKSVAPAVGRPTLMQRAQSMRRATSPKTKGRMGFSKVWRSISVSRLSAGK